MTGWTNGLLSSYVTEMAVGKQRVCQICSHPRVEEIVRLRREGQSPLHILAILHAEGYETLTRAMLDYCLRAAEHHGPMPPVKTTREQAAPSSSLVRLLAEAGIDPDLAAHAAKITVRGPKEWQGFFKTPDGTAEIVELGSARSVTLQLTPEWEGPKWVPVVPARPVTVKVAASKPSSRRWSTCVVLPDIQFGFRQFGHELDPFHDERALRVAVEIVSELRPDKIVLLGDNLDLPEHSRFEQEPAFARTTQAALDACHKFLASLRALVPDAEIVWLEGNHELRLARSIIANTKASYGLRQAATPPESWPVMSIPHLLRLNDLNVIYLSGYPANIYWVNDRVCTVHGEKVRSGGSTAAAVIDDERVSVIFGHIHRIELQHKTRRVREGARQSLAASPGCLCRVDGHVPSTKSGVDVFGRPLTRPENWQQGLAVVTYEPGDGPFGVEIVPIHDGAAFFRGKRYGDEL